MQVNHALPARLIRRHRIVAAIRRHFDAQGFVEVDTPVAIRSPAPERHIDACPIGFNTPHGVEPRFVQTSPELGMKRLLAAGLSKIYQIAPVFRDNDFSPMHRPEFRLLEWYRAHSPWTTLMQDCEDLLRHVGGVLHGHGAWPRGTGCIDVAEPFARISVEDAFLEHAGFSILDHLQRDELARCLVQHRIHHATHDSWDDLFFRVFLQKVEPMLVRRSEPFFLTHFPAPMASLARLCPGDARCAERFELYAGGMELANGFGELTCADTQRQRFVDEIHARRTAGKTVYPLDEHFLAALPAMPPSCGIALGIERLLMVLMDAQDIDAISALPWSQS